MSSGSYVVRSARESRYICEGISRWDGDFFWGYSSEIQSQQIQECNQLISSKINEGRESEIQNLFISMKEDLLDEREFDWIRSGDLRLVFFVHHYLRTQLESANNPEDIGLFPPVKMPVLFQWSTDKDQYINAIYSHFDLRRFTFSGNAEINNKMQKSIELSTAKLKWNSLPSVEWVRDIADEDLLWAKSYCAKKDFIPDYLVGDINEDHAEELRSLLISIMDLNTWNQHRKELFVMKMKGALASRRSRGKPGKKTINCQIDEKLFEKLGRLAKSNDCSKAKMIERLIRWEAQKSKV